MAPRQTARRLLVAAPALALAVFTVTACSPPNEQPADPNAPYTLPTYSEPAKAEESESTQSTTPESGSVETSGEQLPEGVPGEGAPGEGAPGEAPAVGQQAPGAGMEPAS